MATRDGYDDPGTDWWTQNAPPAPAPWVGPPPIGAIPTNPDGSQVGSGIPWDPNTGAPSSSPPGYHWDPVYAMFRPDDPTTTTTTTPVTPPVTTAAPPPTVGVPTSGFGAAPPDYHSDPNAPQFTAMPAYTPPTWTGGDFVNPSEADLMASPGYQARLDSLMKTRERAAAAQGTILSGGTLKALDRAGQDYASNEYQTFRGNALENYKQRYSQFQDAAGMDLNARTYNANQNNLAFQNQTNTYTTNNARTLSDYLTNVTKTRNAELDYWGRLKDVNNTGADLAGSSYRP